MHNIEIFKKQQKNSHMITAYDDILSYQGTYELDFIKTCKIYNINIINSSHRILYNTTDGKKHYYYPDFYIKELNLIIEIKSNYTYEKDLEVNILKQQATINNGFDYIFIIDKKYDEFLNKIKKP